MMFDEYKDHDVSVYAGYLNDKEKLLQSTSGGLATALSEFWIDQGGYVAGVAYTVDFYSAEYILINDKAEVGRLKGSKYFDCNKNNIYSSVKQLLDAGEKVLFFGLPCTVAALYKFVGSRHENLLTCELICHGPTHPKVHSDYVAFLEKKYGSKIVDFSVRYKEGAWTPAYLYAKFDNGEVFKKPFDRTEYGIGFYTLGKEPCYDCKFKGNNRQGDIMIGDFWGAKPEDEFWNEYGVSSIFAETEKGDTLLKAVPGIALFPTTFERAVASNPMVIASKRANGDRKKFSNLLLEKDLMYAVKHTQSFLKSKLKKLMPKKLKKIIKKAIGRR